MTNNYDKLYLYSQNLAILIVEDYKPLCDDLVEIFENFFEIVVSAYDGTEGLLAYNAYHKKYGKHFDIVISDIQMPYTNGIELSSNIRNINSTQNIIILSAHSDKDYLLSFIDIGISKFISKPIDKDLLFEELYRLSMQINMQTTEEKNSHIIKLDKSYSWDINKQLLLKDNQFIDLTKHERIILELLINKKNIVCSNNDILYVFYLYKYDMAEPNIRNHIFKLRKKLPSDMIKSVYGSGYILVISL